MTLSFELPDYPVLGEWRLRVQALTQIEDKTIVVEQYFMPRFEVSQASEAWVVLRRYERHHGLQSDYLGGNGIIVSNAGQIR